jgi:diguanylate cyclase (GGDEF)-like protein/PAS domain S-box-containing protein
MNILSFLHFFVFLVFSYLLIFLLWKDPKSLLNRVCAVLLACFVVWSFGSIFIYNPRSSKDTVMLFDNVASIGWISFTSFFLWFALIFTEKKKILKTRIIYPLIFILPFLLIYKQWTGFLTVDYIKQPWGWGSVWSDSIWAYLFYLYYLSFMAIGLYLILNFGRKTEEPLKKKQAKIIFVAALVSLVFSTLTDVILPELNIRTMPSSLGNVITLIWASGIVYAIAKYKLMVITPVAAADNIISTMADSLILLDRQGNIASVNKAVLDLSGYGKDELEGKSVEVLFREKDFKNTLLDKVIKGEIIRNYELNFKTKTGDNIPVVFSSSTMMDEAGGMAGIVCIIKDVTERKQNEQLQQVLYNISKATNSTISIDQLYPLIHQELGSIIDTTNFYIALVDEKEDNIFFPYHVDEKDDNFPIINFSTANTLTAYVIKNGQPLLNDNNQYKEMIAQGILSPWGSTTPQSIWLGVPLKIEDKTIGVMAVQSYTNPHLYSEKDIKLLEFVSSQVATAIERKRTEEKIRYLSFHDALTDLYNRAYFEEELERYNFPRYYPLSIMMVDVNGLKVINDTFGHHEGDKLLQHSASLLNSISRKGDVIARLGGDEFAILLPSTTSQEAHRICERIRKTCEEDSIKPIYLRPSIALGDATQKGEYQNTEALLKEADKRMYQNKNKNKVKETFQ